MSAGQLDLGIAVELAPVFTGRNPRAYASLRWQWRRACGPNGDEPMGAGMLLAFLVAAREAAGTRGTSCRDCGKLHLWICVREGDLETVCDEDGCTVCKWPRCVCDVIRKLDVPVSAGPAAGASAIRQLRLVVLHEIGRLK